MPINRLNYLSFDFETGGLKPGFNEAISIGAKVYGPNFEPLGGESGEFYSLMKPLHFDRLEPGAMAVNQIKVSELEVAPDQGATWKAFIKWASQWNVSGKGTFGGHPHAVGKNIKGFDLLFVDELNKLHAPKGIEQVIFSKKRMFELEDEMFRWHGFSDELENYKLDDYRVYLGMTSDGAHNAMVDARQTGDIMMRFLKFYKAMATKVVKDADGGTRPFVTFRNSFAPKTQTA